MPVRRDLRGINELISACIRKTAIEPHRQAEHRQELFATAEQRWGHTGAQFATLLSALVNEKAALHISHSNIGNLNLGSQSGDVHSAAYVLMARPEPEMQEAARVLVELANALRASDLPIDAKKGTEQLLTEVATQAALPAPQRSSAAVIRAVLKDLGASLSTAKTLGDLWEKYGPTICGLFS